MAPFKLLPPYPFTNVLLSFCRRIAYPLDSDPFRFSAYCLPIHLWVSTDCLHSHWPMPHSNFQWAYCTMDGKLVATTARDGFFVTMSVFKATWIISWRSELQLKKLSFKSYFCILGICFGENSCLKRIWVWKQIRLMAYSQCAEPGSGNGTGTIGNHGSWLLSLSQPSVDISV